MTATTTNLIVRHVKVDRSRSVQALLRVADKELIGKDFSAAVPRGEGEEVDLHFFRPPIEAYIQEGYKFFMSDERLEAEYEFHGLKPDPFALIALNAAHPEVFHTGPLHPTVREDVLGLSPRNENGRSCWHTGLISEIGYNATHWKDASGQWWKMTFPHWAFPSGVLIGASYCKGWNRFQGNFRFAGVKK